MLLAVIRQLLLPSFLGYQLVLDLLFPAFLWLEYIGLSLLVGRRKPKLIPKKFLPATALSIVLLLSGIYLYGTFTVGKAHRTIIEQAQNYSENEIVSYDGKYLLKTHIIKEDSGTYATFSVFDHASEEELYQCTKQYRTMDLKKIDWLNDSSYTIEVFSGDIGTEIFYFTTNTWELAEKKMMNNEVIRKKNLFLCFIHCIIKKHRGASFLLTVIHRHR